ncbi:hypothetical protein JQK88_35065 [Mesorhizobium caraganae]|uniref:hypothetical protein n=1 Tax=Mesorhizobium caraganae TaxID=483206 RepID=UPI00193A6A25|nr:hypothetical protein [Mesorhizobium caraganae]MBM2716283.1 hypothetical protein [Mesorhizobium caraganae]
MLSITGGQILFDGQDIAAIPERQMNALRWRDIELIPQSAMNSLDPVYAFDRCSTETPQLRQSGTRKVACHLFWKTAFRKVRDKTCLPPSIPAPDPRVTCL